MHTAQKTTRVPIDTSSASTSMFMKSERRPAVAAVTAVAASGVLVASLMRPWGWSAGGGGLG